MNWIAKCWRSFWTLLHLGTAEQELDDEVRFHVESQVEANISAGMTPDEARYAAVRAFGGVDQAKEACRDARGFALLESLWQDLRYGFRMLGKSWGFTAVAVLSLSLGIGANTAMFSIVNTVLLKPLPFKDPDRLVMISHNWPNYPPGAISAPAFSIYKDQAHSFDEVAALDDWSPNLTGLGSPEQLTAVKASASLFPALGVAPALGRTFSAEEDLPGANYVVVLSDGFWKRRFGSDPNIVGQTVALDGIPYKIIGVMPPHFAFPRDIECWTPTAFTQDELSDEQAGNAHLISIAHLRSGVSVQQARAEMDGIVPGIQQRYPQEYNAKIAWKIGVTPLQEVLVGQIRSGLLIVFGLVGLVLLIACANVANLLLARASARQKEIAIRMSIGAGSWRTVRQLLTESVLLGVLGGGLGILMASMTVHLIASTAPEDATRYLPNWVDLGIDHRVFLFTTLLSLGTVAIFGLAPAFHAAGHDVNRALKDEGRGSTSTASHNRLGTPWLVLK